MFKVELLDAAGFKNYENDFFKIYRDSFPLSERHEENVIQARIHDGKYLLFGLISENHQLLGFACIMDVGYENWCVLEYFAIEKGSRNLGLGSRLLEEIGSYFRLKDLKLIVEVEDPKEGEELILKQRRVGFYEKNGFQMIQDFKTMMPNLQGVGGVELNLMVYNYKDTILNFSQLTNLTKSIFRTLYFKDENDALLKEIFCRNNKTIYKLCRKN
jgi:GNAT superfamily N-acetyltransferase